MQIPDAPAAPPRQFMFYSRADYFRALITRATTLTRGDRFLLMTMEFQPDEPLVEALFAELAAAARRGAAVSFALDAYPFMIVNDHMRRPGPLVYRRDLPRRLSPVFERCRRVVEELRAAGGQAVIINWPARRFANPFSGRSHIKLAVCNDELFVGGCNLGVAAQVDLMTSWTDAALADQLYDFGRQVITHRSVRRALHDTDQRLRVDGNTDLLIDAGVRGQSIIFDETLALIDTARQHIFITCQYFPNNLTAKHLAAARKRGVQVQVIFNYPGTYPFPFNLLQHAVVWGERRRWPAALFAGERARGAMFMHAKLLMTDQGTMLGSHNYVRAGVAFGTAEMTLLSRDPLFGEQAFAALKPQLAA
ncbi:MAG TPA: phospholipase D-like domain-containing protein [Candidatus Saccharimonadales bacterium]|nr:phospholipase D-like domain-containing protein [Candidatus Saccharimonadales bacterium]